MYSASFMFEPGTRDNEFHRLNRLIERAAAATPGFLGSESWHAPGGGRVNATYYWETLEALRAFSAHPDHLEAKRRYKSWYGGYHVVISEVLHSYGDGAFEHPTPDTRNHRHAGNRPP